MAYKTFPGSLCRVLLMGLWASRAVILVAQEPILEPLNFVEHPIEAKFVSAGVRTGIMAGDLNGSIDPSRLRVFLPRSDFDLLCVSITAHDGRYEARAEYDVSQMLPGPIGLSLPTSYEGELRGYRAGQLAVLAHLKSSCAGGTGLFAVASWDRQPLPDTVVVLISSPRYRATIVAKDTAGKEVFFECVDVAGDAVRAYDKMCLIPRAQIQSLTGFSVRRTRGAVTPPEVALPIGVP